MNDRRLRKAMAVLGVLLFVGVALPNALAQDQGACCDLGTGECYDFMPEVLCYVIYPGFTWLGPGSDCSECTGGEWGACCDWYTGDCYESPEFDCMWDWLGLGSDCSQCGGGEWGACCDWYTGDCYESPEFDCVWDWLGPGSDCSECTGGEWGACCDWYTGDCYESLEWDCMWDWLGPWSSCEECYGAYGACCDTYTGECYDDTAEWDCYDMFPGFTWLGSGSDCSQCPAPDCNENGIPDECDLDCGEPGGPCDVPGCGQSADCQPNGVPDECDFFVWRRDQQCVDYNGASNLYHFMPIGQEFVPEATAHVAVEICLELWGSPTPVTLQIHEGTLAGPVVPGSEVTVTPASAGWTQCVFSEPIGLIPGQMYVLEAAVPSYSWAWCHGPSDCYAYGQAYTLGTPSPSRDWHFRTLVVSEDCNENGIPDECDIAAGTSADADGNGVPDECELPGDLNCDGLVNSFDIDPFVLALTDSDAYAAAYPECDYMLADCNDDGLVNSFDIDAFVALLTGG